MSLQGGLSCWPFYASRGCCALTSECDPVVLFFSDGALQGCSSAVILPDWFLVTLLSLLFIATVCTSALIGFQKLPVPWNSLPLSLSLSSGTSPAGSGAHCILQSSALSFVLLFPSHPFLGTTRPVLSLFSSSNVFLF